MKKIPCLMCKSVKNKIIHCFDSRNPKIKNLKIAKCDSCGFVFMNPQPSISELSTFYPSSLHEGKRKSRLRFIKEYYENFRLKIALSEFKKKPENLLDIGCSNGFFLKKAEKKNINVFGTEFGKKQLEYLKKNVTENVYASEKELIGKKKFDLITAFDVIEHLPDPESFLANCKKLIKPDGRLIILTLALDSWTYKKFKDRVSWISDQHLFYFTKKEMKKILARHGFELYKVKVYNNSALHFAQFAYQLATKSKIEFMDNILYFAKPKKKKTE